MSQASPWVEPGLSREAFRGVPGKLLNEDVQLLCSCRHNLCEFVNGELNNLQQSQIKSLDVYSYFTAVVKINSVLH